MQNETPLRKALRARGLSMRDAARAGIPYRTIVGHCTERRQMTLRSARRYAEKLGIPIAEIIGLEQGQGVEKLEEGQDA